MTGTRANKQRGLKPNTSKVTVQGDGAVLRFRVKKKLWKRVKTPPNVYQDSATDIDQANFVTSTRNLFEHDQDAMPSTQRLVRIPEPGAHSGVVAPPDIEEEIEELQKELDRERKNVIGKGRAGKVKPDLLQLLGQFNSVAGDTFESTRSISGKGMKKGVQPHILAATDKFTSFGHLLLSPHLVDDFPREQDNDDDGVDSDGGRVRPSTVAFHDVPDRDAGEDPFPAPRPATVHAHKRDGSPYGIALHNTLSSRDDRDDDDDDDSTNYITAWSPRVLMTPNPDNLADDIFRFPQLYGGNDTGIQKTSLTRLQTQGSETDFNVTLGSIPVDSFRPDAATPSHTEYTEVRRGHTSHGGARPKLGHRAQGKEEGTHESHGRARPQTVDPLRLKRPTSYGKDVVQTQPASVSSALKGEVLTPRTAVLAQTALDDGEVDPSNLNLKTSRLQTHSSAVRGDESHIEHMQGHADGTHKFDPPEIKPGDIRPGAGYGPEVPDPPDLLKAGVYKASMEYGRRTINPQVYEALCKPDIGARDPTTLTARFRFVRDQRKREMLGEFPVIVQPMTPRERTQMRQGAGSGHAGGYSAPVEVLDATIEDDMEKAFQREKEKKSQQRSSVLSVFDASFAAGGTKGVYADTATRLKPQPEAYRSTIDRNTKAKIRAGQQILQPSNLKFFPTVLPTSQNGEPRVERQVGGAGTVQAPSKATGSYQKVAPPLQHGHGRRGHAPASPRGKLRSPHVVRNPARVLQRQQQQQQQPERQGGGSSSSRSHQPRAPSTASPRRKKRVRKLQLQMVSPKKEAHAENMSSAMLGGTGRQLSFSGDDT